MSVEFQHTSAFSRNIGWVTEAELRLLQGKRIAIAGLGGVGGGHLLSLARLGIGRFNISDLDRFELVNFNRQVGATMSHLDRPKVDVLEEAVLDINPDLDLRTFPDGVDASNVEAFLSDVDLYVDGLDFFAVSARRAVFAACAEVGVPAVTAAPLGWGVSLLTFLPGEMTFEEYFQMGGKSEEEMLRRFLVGLSPEGIQLGALVDASRLDIEHHRGPSTVVGCDLCVAAVAATAAKILLGRGDVHSVPKSVHFDAYSTELRIIERPGGMSHPEMQSRLAGLRSAS